MRESIKEFVKMCASSLPLKEPIYEFGSLQVPGQEKFADLRPFFPGKKYVGADMRQGPGVDVLLNLHNVKLPDESVGSVLILDTLEHVEFVHKAMNEIHRILKRNGIVVISSVMNFPIHDYPFDYWRFTPEAFISLLKPFKSVIVESAGNPAFPHTVVGIGFKSEINEEQLSIVKQKVKLWKLHAERDSFKIRIKKFLQLMTPPILWNIIKHIIQGI